ncbi:serine/threonine-protein phosphatase 2A regulatory subunit B'' subunit delta-like isoform X2 [Peromyscus maniculatus bairdii]|uniref:serine/threonine-protein phosphatase 2A regulatory subunit B'' subunit delta-like isoform X2 n=1 Tax=Peromyscus maniculatus bairdii TaxID=230844 RepID=UPI003FCFE82B
MAPGRPLPPALRRKVDELFLRWLGDPGTRRDLRLGLRRIRGAEGGGARPATPTEGWDTPTEGRDTPTAAWAPPTDKQATAAAASAAGDPAAGNDGSSTPEATPTATRATPTGDPVPPRGPCALRTGPGGDVTRRTVQALPPDVLTPPPEAPPPTAGPAPGPALFFPRPCPPPARDLEAAMAAVEAAFAQLPRRGAGPGDMGAVAKACGLPLYWKSPLFHAAGGHRVGAVSAHDFLVLWRKVLLSCHDEASKFVQLLGSPGRAGLGPENFRPLLEDVVASHPGLSFLKEAPEIQSRYVTVVTQRIFYTVNRSWSGRISCAELRRSRFLQAVARLEAEPDLARMTEFFSYEHFYVIDCKFRELDLDGDLLIDACDLGRYGDGAISSRMIDRIFSGAVMRSRPGGPMSYTDFVWFLLSEEDKTTPTSIEYWFRCMDLHGRGVLAWPELEFFHAEQARRLAARGLEPMALRDFVCWALDVVGPHTPGRIALRDLKRSGMAAVFFDAFFNLDKFLAREATPTAPDDPAHPSPWAAFAAAEFEFLAAEEVEAAAAGEAWGDDERDDDSDSEDDVDDL